jgi:predicted nucleic acid-binding protein
MPTVVDASAFVQHLLRAPGTDVVADAIHSGKAVAPDVAGVEALSAIAGLERGGKLDAGDATVLAHIVRSVPFELVPIELLLGEAWALRHDFSLYDALYVALADVLHCPLITSDARLARAVEGRTTVTLIA